MPGRHSEVLFDIQRIFGHFECIKQRGIRVTLIMTSLLVMLFYKSMNIHSYFTRQFGKYTGTDRSKNPYYDLLGSEYNCWRSILYLFAKRYLSLVRRNSCVVKKIRALIFDNTVLEKSGKKIEGVSRVHDHVTGRFIFGYKLLVCGYWDGVSFIPVDFSLHRERGSDLDRARRRRNRARRKVKQVILIYRETRRQYLEQRAKLKLLREESGPVSKKTIQMDLEKQQSRVVSSWKKQSKSGEKMKQAQAVLKQKEELVRKKEKTAPLYGLPSSRLRKQFKKDRHQDSPGYQRRSEADMSKAQSVINMLSRAVKRGFVFDYVLFDSWIFSKEILARIESFRTKAIKLIAMVKMCGILYLDCFSGEQKQASGLRKLYHKKARRSRRYNATYIKVPVWYNNSRLVSVRRITS